MRKSSFAFLAGIFVIFVFMIPSSSLGISEEEIRAVMREINELLEDMGENVRLEVVEYYTAWNEMGQEVFFNNRSKQLKSHFVPYDADRFGVSDIYWLSDQVDGTAAGLTQTQTQDAVDRAMATWDSVNCSTIPLVKLPDQNFDWGYTQSLVGMGGFPGWIADLTHAGWLPGRFFELTLGPGASADVLGATFTFIWAGPTDIDNNGKYDVAFRETYYNNEFPWGIDTDWPIDVESIVLHETGHLLSQGHFGKLFRTKTNDKLHFAPRSVMNSGYTGIQQVLTGSDIGGHCSIWASWPNE